MKVLIACDSFKDALSAMEVCQAIENGLKMGIADIETIRFPLADGGEGTAEILTYHSQGMIRTIVVNDPLSRPVKASYGISKDGTTAFIEMAAASGLPLLKPEERRAALTSTFGTGELVLDAIAQGARSIFLGIGGSATNDVGMGMAQALGYRFLDREGKELQGTGENLIRVAEITAPENPLPADLKVNVICDVDNPLYGPKGAAFVYAPQKGASSETVKQLDEGLQHFSQILQAHFKKDFALIPGAGAAGGLGAGAMAFLGAQLQAGISTVLAYTNIDQYLPQVDLIITGEGKLDHQTLHGKLIHGICQKAAQFKVPVVALCGTLTAKPHQIKSIGLRAAFSIMEKPRSLAEAISDTACLLEETSFNLIRSWCHD